MIARSRSADQFELRVNRTSAEERLMHGGEWIVQHDKPGTLSTMDQRWLLERLTDAVATSPEDGDEISGKLDPDDAAKTSTGGISDEWMLTYRVMLDGDRISRTAFECVGADSKVAVSWAFTLTSADITPIDPPTDATDSRECIALHLHP